MLEEKEKYKLEIIKRAISGTITNAVWKAEEFCKVGKCLYFDGTGDYVSFSDNANLDMGTGETVTVEGWFRTPDISSGTRTLVSKYICGQWFFK